MLQIYPLTDQLTTNVVFIDGVNLLLAKLRATAVNTADARVVVASQRCCRETMNSHIKTRVSVRTQTADSRRADGYVIAAAESTACSDDDMLSPHAMTTTTREREREREREKGI